MSAPLVSEVSYTPARPDLQQCGLLGFIQCVVGGLLRVNCSLRRSRDGRLVLSFPVKHDKHGRQLSLVAPVSAEVRMALEQAVIEAVAIESGTASPRSKAQGDSAGATA